MQGTMCVWLVAAGAVLQALVAAPSFGQQTDIALMKTVGVGGQGGEIGYEKSIAGGAPSPITFFVEDGQIYVIDGVNNRVNVYDEQFSYIRSIWGFPRDFYVCDEVIMFEGEYIATNPEYLYGIALDGSLLFKIGRQQLWGDNPVNRWGLFAVGSLLFFYDSLDKVNAIDRTGTVIGSRNALDLLRKLPENNGPDGAELLRTGLRIMVGSQYLTPSYQNLLTYLDSRDPAGSSARTSLGKVINSRLIGLDRARNSYWSLMVKGPRLLVAAFSATGGLLRSIDFTDIVDLKKGERVPVAAVNKDGLVYLMVSRPEETLFFKALKN